MLDSQTLALVVVVAVVLIALAWHWRHRKPPSPPGPCPPCPPHPPCPPRPPGSIQAAVVEAQAAVNNFLGWWQLVLQGGMGPAEFANDPVTLAARRFAGLRPTDPTAITSFVALVHSRPSAAATALLGTSTTLATEYQNYVGMFGALLDGLRKA